MKDIDKKLWEACAAFHGHECGGLAIGYQASLYAMELLGLERAPDEEVVCITENDACGVDAVQVLLGCTLGKGNLLLKPRGKQAFSFYNRKTGQSVRLVLRDVQEPDPDKRKRLLMDGDCHALFDVKEAAELLPEPARIFQSCTCAKCGERTAESYVRLHKGEMLCTDCFPAYSRIL